MNPPPALAKDLFALPTSDSGPSEELAVLGLFAEALPNSEAAWLNYLPRPREQQTARARQVIYGAGEALDVVPLICEGWAACVSRLSDGRRQILSFLLPGDLVSAGAVFTGSVNFFVEAITSVRYAHYDRGEVTAKLSEEPRIFRALLTACLAEKTAADNLATDLGRRSAGERIARLFLHLKERLEARGLVSDQAFAVPLRQQHIADATGLTPVHVNRVIGSFRNNGLIEMAGGTLKVLNLAALQRVADMR
jgi:CRP/FNR family transcriptional regulator, anaerobic regulatory protein